MDTVVQAPSEDGSQQKLSLVDTTEWTGVNADIGSNSNGPYLYIAIKMDQENGMATQQEVYSDFDPHVSPLDPNMSSVARYSPVYNEPLNDFNPIVFVTHNSESEADQLNTNLGTPSSLENIPAVLCNNDIRDVNNQYLELVNENGNIVNVNNVNNLQLVPENEQEVELLITDQATGISYSVSTNELLVERCLDDPQLLEGLTPEPLLDSDLLALGDGSTGLNDDIINVNQVDASVNNYINSLATQNVNELNFTRMETRNHVKTETVEESSLSCVYSISDKPILSRARASLPESFLVINKIDNEDAVFAKRLIAKRTQFGPLEGVLVESNSKVDSSLCFFVTTDAGIATMDVSIENTCNWMRFVRPASTYDEQNLVITEEDGSIYFTTTKNIQPKQELKVGYSSEYAKTYKLDCLEPKPELWPCYECNENFTSSQLLQKHLDVHDEKSKDENVKPLNVLKHKRKKKHDPAAIECNICFCIFSQYNYSGLKKHLNEAHNLTGTKSVEESFSIVTNYSCEVCQMGFKSEALLKIHNLEHDPDSSEEQINHVCPACQRKFPTQKQLINHVSNHSLPKTIVKTETIKCPICYKGFSNKERVQRHMMVHGSEENKPIKCDSCPKRFLNNSALACHIKTHFSGKKIFDCPICKESFDNVLKLKLHVPVHCVNNQYTCPYCHKIFKQYCIIRKHIRAFHCDKKFRCNQCPAAFPNHDKLKLHQLRHSDHKEFLCAGCGKQFKRMDKLKEHIKKKHSEERENKMPIPEPSNNANKKVLPKSEPTDFHRFIYKCHTCLVGFKRRGMLVNHLAKRHPDVPPDSVPELNLPILQTTRIYYCQYCDKVYKSSSKRKSHILKNHPGAALPMSTRRKQNEVQLSNLPNPTFSQTVGSITTSPQNCDWCHKQYASKAKLLQHRAKKHADKLAELSDNKSDNQDNDNTVNQDMPEEVNDNIGMINSTIDGYKIEDESQYLSINENCGNFMETGELESPSLYRLLTAGNGMLPPR